MAPVLLFADVHNRQGEVPRVGIAEDAQLQSLSRTAPLHEGLLEQREKSGLNLTSLSKFVCKNNKFSILLITKATVHTASSTKPCER